MQDIPGYDETTVIEKLQQLESKKIIKRVGFYANVIVLIKYITPWSAKIGEKYIIPTPWLTLTGDIRLEIFFKWCGVVMNLIFEKPGSSIVYLAEKGEYISYRAVQDICMFLEKYECVKLSVAKNQQIDIFSDVDIEPEFAPFNPYDSPENILAFPIKNSLSKFCYVKKRMLESHDKRCTIEKVN